MIERFPRIRARELALASRVGFRLSLKLHGSSNVHRDVEACTPPIGAPEGRRHLWKRGNEAAINEGRKASQIRNE